MAEFKTTVALEIGAQTVTMAVFNPSGHGFALSRYAQRNIVLDPVEEGLRIDYVSNAVAELVTELKVKGSDVRNVVSGQQVFMRFLKLPALDMDDLEEQVGFEALQHIPFPLDEIVYSYQVLGSGDAGERDVLLVAIKKNVLDELHGQVSSNGLHPKSVDCSISSLYNAFRIGYPEEQESVMIIDIGAKTTDIIFSENGRFYTRSVTAAGSFITNAISREFKLSFLEAEAIKVEKGLISLGSGHTDDLDEQTAALATTIRTAMGRLSSEVQRTINHYRAQYKGNAPVKAYICGGGARMPYAVEYLNAALNISVEHLNPLAAFSIGSKIDETALSMDALCLGPVAGAAVTGAKVGEFNIDLVPTVLGKDRAEKALLLKVVVAGAIALAGAGFFAYQSVAASTAATNSLKKIEAQYERVSNIADTVVNLNNRYSRAGRELKEISELYLSRTTYADILLQIAEKSPSVKFWITEFTPMINYDVANTELTGALKVKGQPLIDMARSRNGSPESSINKAPDSINPRNRNKDPKVTAIYVSGYTLKSYGKSDNDVHRAVIRDLVNNNFDERSKDSLFLYKAQEVSANQNRYFRFVSAEETKGKMPEYVEKFMVIMPLKTPINIPELSKK